MKIKFFSGAAPLEPEGKQRGLKQHVLTNSPPGKLTKFTYLFLVYMLIYILSYNHQLFHWTYTLFYISFYISA